MTFGGKSLTKADLARREAIHAGNCMACAQLGIDMSGSGYVQWHHTAGKQHHDQTCGLCQWHHMARPMFGWTHVECRARFGPSLAEGSKPFHAQFGSDDELLRQQNALLGIETQGEAA